MKKYLFIAVLFLALGTISKAQFKILNAYDNSTITNTTINVYGNPVNAMGVTFYIVNSGGVPISLYSRRDSISLLTWDTNNYFCWATLCYPSSTNVSTYDETVNPGDTSKTITSPDFYTHFDPGGKIGTSTIRYTFYNASNHADSNWVLVNYITTPAGIATVSDKSINFSSLYPNPAGSSVNFNYNLAAGVSSANLKIFNMLGECIQTITLNASKNKATVNVQAIPSGIYICELEANGCQPAYQKLIVSR